MVEDLVLVFFALLVYLAIRFRASFFRFAALAAIFFLIANPVIRKKSPAPPPVLAICLDTSASMAVRDGSLSRIASAKEALRKELPELRKKFSLLFYTFDSSLRQLEEGDFFSAEAQGRASLISRSVSALTAALPEGAALLLLSDGRDSAPEASYFSKPVHSVGFGAVIDDDMSVKVLEYPERVFQGAVSKVRLRLERAGQRSGALVTISRGGRKLAEKAIIFEEGESVKDVDVEFVPDEPGENMRYRVELSPSDSRPENNRDFFSVSVFKSLMKVLFISGRPGWEYSNLRALIKSDKRIDLTSFVILRNPSDYVPFPENKLSLIPFPVREIFLNDIVSYDLVILLNFDYSQFIGQEYLAPLARHISAGGALMLIGGEKMSGGSNYFQSPLGGLLPIKELPGAKFSEEKFFIKASRSHSVTSFIASISEAGEVPLKGLSPSAGLVKDAESLLETAAGTPVAAAREEGKGRIMLLLTNSLWRLFFAGPETSYFYQEFFKNSFAWLTRSPLLDEISLSGRKNYKTGEEMLLRIQLRNPEHSGITVTHVAPGGPEYLAPVMISPGLFTASARIEDAGRHSVRISLSGERGVRAEKNFTFTASASGIEDENISASHSYLKEISGLSLGRYLGSASFSAGDIPSPADDSVFYYPAMTKYYLLFAALLLLGLWFRENIQ